MLRAARRTAVQGNCVAFGGPLGDDPWVTNCYRACSAECEETAGFRWAL
jgi:hypothetical protein